MPVTDVRLLFEGLAIGLWCVIGEDICLRFVPRFMAIGTFRHILLRGRLL